MSISNRCAPDRTQAEVLQYLQSLPENDRPVIARLLWWDYAEDKMEQVKEIARLFQDVPLLPQKRAEARLLAFGYKPTMARRRVSAIGEKGEYLFRGRYSTRPNKYTGSRI